MEIWKDINEYEGIYKASNHGNIKRVNSNKILKAQKNSKGILIIKLCKNGKSTTYCVHRIIASLFKIREKGKNVVIHIDGNLKNNNSENLKWARKKPNSQKLSEKEVIKIKNLLSKNTKGVDIQKNYFPNIHLNTIYGIKREENWKNL